MDGEHKAATALRQQLAENERIIARLNQDLAKKTKDVQIIQQISSEITSTLEFDRILAIILDAMERTLCFEHIMVLLHEEAGGRLRVAASRGYPDPGIGAGIAVGDGVIGVVAERKRLMRMGNVSISMRYLASVRERMGDIGEKKDPSAAPALPGLSNVQSQLAIPLLVKDKLIGVIAVESARPNAFDELDEVVLNIVANQSATAIENARAYETVEHLSRLKRFFSPQLAELIVEGGTDDPLKTHRRDITVVFLDLRGFTAFSESVEPEEVMGVLREFHAEMGVLIEQHEGTLERFTGDGMMIFFNDPVLIEDAAERAVRMALAMRGRVTEIAKRWRKRGFDLDLGVGIASGYATLGSIGFERRWDYGAIGNVTNLAARLCGEALGGQILISQRVLGELEEVIEVEDAGQLTLKGLARPVKAFSLIALK